MFKIFYPAEMTLAIKDLEAHDDLNKLAVSVFNTHVGLCFFPFTLMFIMAVSAKSYLLAFLFFCCPITLSTWMAHKMYYKVYKPYLINPEQKTGVITGRPFDVTCRLEDGKEVYFEMRGAIFYNKFNLRKGIRLKLLLIDGENRALANIHEINMKSCLSKSFVKENEKYSIRNIHKENNKTPQETKSDKIGTIGG